MDESIRVFKRDNEMITDQFIAKYNGIRVGDGQCMALMHQYCGDAFGLTPDVLKAVSALKAFTNFQWPQHFSKTVNTPAGVPNKGDLIFFSTPPYGHVAIFFSGDINQFTSFDQNWPLGTTPHLQRHDYKQVLGWLRYIG